MIRDPHPTSIDRCQVVAFFAHDRTSARVETVANIAALLSLGGLRVLVVTGDLTLSRYFAVFPAVTLADRLPNVRAADAAETPIAPLKTSDWP